MQGPREAGEDAGRAVHERFGPRFAGIIAVAVGFTLIALTSLMLEFAQKYSPTMVVFSPVLIGMGGWITLTGRSQRTPDNPLWWKLGAGVIGVLCAGVGFYVAFGVLG